MNTHDKKGVMRGWGAGTILVLGLAMVIEAQAVCSAGGALGSVVESTPTADFSVHGDGTVTHLKTGLMWKQCIEGVSGGDCTIGEATVVGWSDALSAASLSRTAGYSDWRMPNFKEMLSIYETCGSWPSINLDVFPNFPPNLVLWSSTSSLDVWQVANSAKVVEINDYESSVESKGDLRLFMLAEGVDYFFDVLLPLAFLNELDKDKVASASLLVRGGHVVWADFDELVPRLAGVGVTGTGVTSETLSALSHVSATGYWIVVAQGSAAPTSLQVKAGGDYSVALATVGVVAAGNGDMVELTDTTFSVTGLTAGTGYDLYLVGYSVNNDGLGYTPSKISFITDVDSDGDGVGDRTDLFPADPARAVSCLAGSYGAYSCVAAAPGYYVPVADALVQTACAAGSYTDVTGSASCTPAPQGSYVDTIGAAAAASCPTGDSTVTVASSSSTDCLLDTDLDGNPDTVDTDDDGDGVLDADDAFPLDATRSSAASSGGGAFSPFLLFTLLGSQLLFRRRRG